MDKFFGRLLNRFAPRTARAFIMLRRASETEDGLLGSSTSRENDIAELRREIDELRQDSRRVAELYDLVFERLKRETPWPTPNESDPEPALPPHPDSTRR